MRNLFSTHRGGAVTFATAALLAMSACGSPVSDVPRHAGTVKLSIDNSAGTAVAITPRSATLVYGYGILLKAQVLDASGQPMAGAKAAWRSTNPSVATATVLADTGLASDYGRAAVSSIGPGNALMIASYENVADTAIITVVPRTDRSSLRQQSSERSPPTRAAWRGSRGSRSRATSWRLSLPLAHHGVLPLVDRARPTGVK